MSYPNTNARRQKQRNGRSQPSILLSNAENQQLQEIVGNRSVSLASAVVQVVIAPAPHFSSWKKKCCGVACFIKDNTKRTYFIRVYNLKTRGMIWEQELYNQFKYRIARSIFHTFDGQDSPVGLNFANEEEANQFKAAVNEKLRQREHRKHERKKSQHGQPNLPPPMARSVPEISTPALPMANVNKGDTLGRKVKDTKEKNKKGNKKPKITKEDIGTPTDFRHVGHVGWDPEKGFDMNKLDPSLKKLFDTIGISDHQLQDKETAKFIYDFIDQHGGLEAVKRDQEIIQIPPPPPPSRSVPLPPPPSFPSGPPPPPPPSRSPAGPPPPPPPSRMGRNMGAPPPPPPMSRSEAPPPPSRSLPPPPPPAFSPPAPMPPPMGGPPPPPPPPGPPPLPPPGPPPPPVPGLPPPPPSGGVAESGERGALLDQIRAGKMLSHKDHQAGPPPPSHDPRDQLLDQIRGGMVLKKMEPGAERPMSDAESGEGIAAALANALANRADKIQGDSDSEVEEEDDSDWDD